MYALVDCNSFYCSCERLFRPELLKRPVVVLSNNDGCIVSLTKEAKLLGLKMGEPFFKVEKLIKEKKVAYFSSNYALYGDLSNRVMSILEEEINDVEVYSIDEAFLKLEAMEQFEYQRLGEKIKERVFLEVGIPVSVGIAKTKVLAKIANHIAKKNAEAQGVFVFPDDGKKDDVLKKFPVSEIWGIGSSSSMKLLMLKIKSAYDLKYYENEKEIQKILTKKGRQIQDELREISCVETESFEKKKTILSTKSFGASVYLLKELEEAISVYITRACEKLRKEESLAASMLIFIRTNPFKETPQYAMQAMVHFSTPTDNTFVMIKEGKRLLEKIFLEGFEYKKAGVMLMDLSDSDSFQLSLFDDPKKINQNENLMKVVDKINQRYHEVVVKSLACGTEGRWKMQRQFKSPSYTTRWSDLLKIKI